MSRPKITETEKRTSAIYIRCLQPERDKIKGLANQLGLSLTDYVLKRALNEKIVANKIDLLKSIDAIGLELSRAGNNINQLAKHANQMSKLGQIDAHVFERLTSVLSSYMAKQDDLKRALRSLIRQMSDL